MVRAPYYDEKGIKKGAWSEEEDRKLIAYIERHGHPNWRRLPKSAGLARCGKSCRLRWMNYLRPNLKRGNYTEEEEQRIIDLHKQHGNKWSLIAKNLLGRTDNEIKNYWHSHLKKFLKRNKTKRDDDDHDQDESESKSKPSSSECTQQDEGSKNDVVSADFSHHILESSNISSETSYTEDNTSISFSSVHAESSNFMEVDSVASWETFDGFSSDFWTEPFILENVLSNYDDYNYMSDWEVPLFLW